MKLSDLDLIKLLPVFMRKDEAVQGLSTAINLIIPELYRKVKLFELWDKIDELDHVDLDELAWELNVEWYDQEANILTKRQLVRQSDLIHARLGTKWAVEQVISAHFGTGEVREWFQYGGKPYHFKVISSNPNITNKHVEKFLRILEVVKRKSAWLDSIQISLTGEMKVFAGICVHDTAIEHHSLGVAKHKEFTGQMHIYANVSIHEATIEKHTLGYGKY